MAVDTLNNHRISERKRPSDTQSSPSTRCVSNQTLYIFVQFSSSKRSSAPAGRNNNDSVTIDQQEQSTSSLQLTERASTRSRARFTCCVPKCTNDERSIRTDRSGRPLRFYDLPENSDRRLRRQWMNAVPELEFAVSPAHRKVHILFVV